MMNSSTRRVRALVTSIFLVFAVNTFKASARNCGSNPMKSMMLVAESTGQSISSVMSLLKERHQPLHDALIEELNSYSACVGLLNQGYFKRTDHRLSSAPTPTGSRPSNKQQLVAPDSTVWNLLLRRFLPKDIGHDAKTALMFTNRQRRLDGRDSNVLDEPSVKYEHQPIENLQVLFGVVRRHGTRSVSDDGLVNKTASVSGFGYDEEDAQWPTTVVERSATSKASSDGQLPTLREEWTDDDS